MLKLDIAKIMTSNRRTGITEFLLKHSHRMVEGHDCNRNDFKVATLLTRSEMTVMIICQECKEAGESFVYPILEENS